MGEIIPFGQQKEKKGEPPVDAAPWKFTMEFYRSETGSWSAEITAFEPDAMEVADRMRFFADGLEQIEVKLRKKAEQISPGEHGGVVASVKVFDDSMVKVWIDEENVRSDDLRWLDERFDDAKEVVRL